MDTTTFDVRIYKTDVYVSKKKGGRNTYWVRWKVAKQIFKEPFGTVALSESFRSDLVAASRKGEAFRGADGLPVSMGRQSNEMTWYAFCCAYAEMKWEGAAGNSRKGVAETLVTVMPFMLTTQRGKPEPRVIRHALNQWAFNLGRRDVVEMPSEIASALKWLTANTCLVSTLADPVMMRGMLGAMARKLDGNRAAVSVIKRKRAVLYNAMEYAVECKLLDTNPIPALKWKTPRSTRAIDKRCVVNPKQAENLLAAVRVQQPSGPRLEAFFGTMYYAALRPGEAANLKEADVSLPDLVWDEEKQEWAEPEDAWGEFLLSESAPETGASWSETGTRRDLRELKHRAVGEVRSVPSPPPLTKLLRAHMIAFPPNIDGLIFYGERGGQVSESTYSRAWRQARRDALTDAEQNSPLARRAYDLRHACVSMQLNGGVAPTQVAEWAGQSLAVLYEIYAKCLAGQEHLAKRRIEEALRQGGAGPA